MGYAFLALQAYPFGAKKRLLAKSGRPVLIEKTFRKNLGERASILPKCPNPRVKRDALLTPAQFEARERKASPLYQMFKLRALALAWALVKRDA